MNPLPRSGKVTEETLIPIGLAVLAIGGGTVWLTTIHNKTEVNTRAIAEISAKQESSNDLLKSIDRRLSRIEGKLDIK